MVVALIQARMGSVRLPNKVMKLVNGKPLISYLLNRVSKAQFIDKVVVATSTNPNNDPLVSYVKSIGFDSFRGDEQDVLSRFYEAAKLFGATVILRITADCPLVDPLIIDNLISDFKYHNVDYATNTLPPTYPDGLDVEVLSFRALEQAYYEAKAPNEREHVTPYIRYSGKFKIYNRVNDVDYSDKRWTVDEPEDFEVVRNIFDHFHPDIFFSWERIIEAEKVKSSLFEKNKGITRNEGALLTNNEKYTKRAFRLGLARKNKVSNNTSFFWQKSLDNKLIDSDNKTFIDFSENNLFVPFGCQIRGGENRFVSNNIYSIEQIEAGEKFIQLHDWAEVIEFSSSLEESLWKLINVCKTQQKFFYTCSYNSINNQLLLKIDLKSSHPAGVTSDGCFSCDEEDLLEDSLSLFIGQNAIGILMLDMLSFPVDKIHLISIFRKATIRNKIILVFDESKSANRINIGGLHRRINCEPDVCLFGPSIANGLPVGILIAKSELSYLFQETNSFFQLITNEVFSNMLTFLSGYYAEDTFWESVNQRSQILFDKVKQLKDEYNLPYKIQRLNGAIRLNDLSANGQWTQSLYRHMLSNCFLCNDTIALNALHDMQAITAFSYEMEKYAKYGMG